MLSTEQELKVSRMTKRSQNRKLFSRDNYRLREFVLQTYCIRYFEVSGGIAYADDALSTTWYLLYIVANSAIERDDWISLVRFYTREHGARFVPRYHPGVWKRPGRYTCCDDINRLSMGCQPTNEPGPPAVVEQLWRTVSCSDQQQNYPLAPVPAMAMIGALPSTVMANATTGTAISTNMPMNQTPPVTLQMSTTGLPFPSGPAVCNVSTQAPIHTVASMPSTGAVPVVVATAAAANTVILNAQQQSQNTPLSLSALQHLSVTSGPLRSGVMMPTPAIVSTTTSPNNNNLFQLQQQQALFQQQQLAAALSSGVNQPITPLSNNGIRRSGHGQNRTQPVRYTQQPALFDMDDNENTVIAVHNYNPVRENQLPLQKGEKYHVVNQSNAQWWYVRNMTGQLGYVPTNYVHKPNSLNSFDWYYKDITRQHAEAILLDEGREGCFIVRDSVSKKNTFTLSVTAKDPEVVGKLKVHHYHIHRTETLSQTSNGNGNGHTMTTTTNGLSAQTTNGTNGMNLTNHPHQPNGNGSGGRSERVTAEAQYYLSEKHAFPSIKDVIHYHKHNSGGLVVRLRSPPTKDRESPVTAGMGLDEFELDPIELQLDPEPIGKGQFGVVKRGRFRNIPVAVKQMVEGAMNEDDFIEEAKNLRFLNHPNLVQLFGVVLKKRPIMIITEYMKHGSLRDYMRQRQNLFYNRPVVLADICAQVANGMAYLEQEQFVHRDLAARNCLVKTVSRNSVQVKVADFGMARFLLDNVYEPSAGTKFPVRWAPPEVFQSTYTAKADVWSFGVLMWEVFTSCTENPYQGKNNTEVYQHIIAGGRLQKPAICPQHIYVLMLECWQHDPNRRPSFEYICQKIGTYLDQNCEN